MKDVGITRGNMTILFKMKFWDGWEMKELIINQIVISILVVVEG
ncbi:MULTISPECIES: hypothetical protein [Clostridium]|nr:MULTISPECIES: hypothetical protein [Clostridium]